MSEIILSVKNLKKSFNKVNAVNNISFDIEKGDVFGFLGSNGSGKTTTIRMILGLLKPTDGQIFINGNNLTSNLQTSLSQMGALVEGPAFYGYMSAEENLELFGAYSGGLTKEKIQDLLQLVGLSNRGKDKVSKYSLGMKQRLGIAQALLNDPKLLILDEPTNGLDPQGMKEIRELIGKLSKEGITIFISSHMLSEVEQICNKIFIINKGEKIIEGLTDELLHNEVLYEITSVDNDLLVNKLKTLADVHIESINEKVKIRISKNLLPEDLLDTLVKDGVRIKSFNPITLSLEDFFFRTLEVE